MALYGSFLYGDGTVYGSGVSYNDYLLILQSPSRQPRVKVELLYKNNNGYEVYEELTSLVDSTSGSLQINIVNGRRRSATITLSDFKRQYNISSNSLWLDSYIRIKKGFQVGNEYIWFLCGTFVLEDPSVISNFSLRTIELTCVDKMSILENELEAIYQIPSGTPVKDAIIAILNEINDPMPLIYDSALEGKTVPYTISRSDSYYSILEELASLYSSHVFYNASGSLCFLSGVEGIDDSPKESLYNFRKDGTDINYISSNVKYDISNVKNYIVVIGATVDGELYDAIASDENLSSPVNIYRIGKRVKKIEDDNIYSTELAQNRADYELKNNTVLFCNCSIVCLSLPHLYDADDAVVTLTDIDQNFNQQRLLIQSITDSFGIDSQMQITCSNTSELPFI
jgi:hypothetical protein